MRTPFVGRFGTTLALLLTIASCGFPSSTSAPSCDSDVSLCPQSTRDATSVSCDCECTLGIDVTDSSSKYAGRVDVCLPAELNVMTASPDQRVALDSLEPQLFDQRVFGYCSHDVADFLRTAIQARANVTLVACAVPLKCECTTQGTRHDSSVCHAGCDDIACDTTSCTAVLTADQKLGLSRCFCSRATACGLTVPASSTPGVCRDWLTQNGQ